MSLGKCLLGHGVAPISVPKKNHFVQISTLFSMHSALVIGSFLCARYMLDTGATAVSKVRCLPSRSSHNLAGGEETHSQFAVIITMPGVATKINFLKAEGVDSQVQAPGHMSSASCYRW